MDKYTAEINKAVGLGIGAVVTTNLGIALRIQCIAGPAQGVDYADAVLVTATSLVLSVNGVADTTFSGGTGTLLFATYTTLGALVDQINSSSNWNAEIVAGLRSDSINSSQLVARTTSTFRMYKEVDINWDSNVCKRLDYLLESQLRPFAYARKGMPPEHRVGFQRLICLENGAAPVVNVYELLPDKATTLRTLASPVLTNNTEKDTGVDAPVINAGFGNSILIRLSEPTTWSNTGAYLKVFGFRE